MRFTFVFLILSLFFFSFCNTITERNLGENSQSFEHFFWQFNNDSSFQVIRTEFPLPYISKDILDEVDTIFLQRKKWKFNNFLKEDSLSLNRSVDKYKTVIEENKNTVLYKRVGIDNGIRIDYHFIRKSKKWYLVQILDMST